MASRKSRAVWSEIQKPEYLHPYGSWAAPGQFAFQTRSSLTFKKLTVYTRRHTDCDDGWTKPGVIIL